MQENRFLERIVEWVAHPIFVKDRAFRFVLVNRAFCEMTGFSAEAMLGRTDYDLFPASEADFFRQKDLELLGTKGAVDIAEEPITDARGVRHLLATTKVPLLDDDGVVTHIVGIIHDITRLKEAEEALRRTNDALEERVASRTRELEAAQADLVRKERLALLGQLAGGVAHQIRNPLAAIKNAAYVIERQARGLPVEDAVRNELSAALRVIHEEIDGANTTITALLEHARVRHADKRPIAVQELVRVVLASLRVPPEVSVVSELEGLPEVAVDLDQTKSALANVLVNAVEAMPEGGTITLRGSREGEGVLLSISDNGPGIPDEVRDHLFEPLVTTKPLGLGLGLVTARTLLAGQGGRLELGRSEKGTVFVVWLPGAARA